MRLVIELVRLTAARLEPHQHDRARRPDARERDAVGFRVVVAVAIAVRGSVAVLVLAVLVVDRGSRRLLPALLLSHRALVAAVVLAAESGERVGDLF
jgi:hypothetical protein